MAEEKDFEVLIRSERCKECGICIAFCPQQILAAGEDNKPVISSHAKCSGCKMCEFRCPDLAVTVRRKGDSGLENL